MVRWLFCFLFFYASCGGGSVSYDYRIALDPEWYSLDLQGREAAVRAFSVELLEEISKDQNIKLAIYDRNWNDLMWGLQKENYEGILSPMQPYLFYEKLYSFSDLYLLTGPTVVVPMETNISSLEDFADKEVAVIEGSNDSLILEKYPAIIQRTYGSASQALLDTANGVIEGAVVDILTAKAYCLDLYKGKLKVALPPLNEQGLRLVTLHDKASHLLELFNEGLHHLKKNGKYAELARKWGLTE